MSITAENSKSITDNFNKLNRVVVEDSRFKWLGITLIFPLVFLNGWLGFKFLQYCQPLVTIFLLAGLLAFILNYPVSILQRRGVKRTFAVASVFIFTLLVVTALGVTLIPVVLQQFHEMMKLLPQWVDSGEQKIQVVHDWAISHGLNVNVNQIYTKVTDRLPDELQFLTNNIFQIVVEALDSISEAIITVVLTFYFLIDGERLWNGTFKRLPFNSSQKIQQSLQKNFQNYLIAQLALGLLEGVSLTIVLFLLKVPFALLFGLGVGISCIIPFGDVVGLSAVTLIIAVHHFGLALKVLAVAVVVDQIIDQAIAPRLLGSITGLRPIWVLISLLVFTYTGGLLGLLIAVPVAGFIKDAVDGFPGYSNN
ncbi:hypothetical protein NIES267_41870 [Calothrix parasitica NIES-267]|uniref:Permease n=1 Tax=Calothrix parasitica NIES-267 TaxID=1973488 RepID=A0A1Z4LU59_9CYAN|nr:hypothetical protein NIES267_41870 [Calothrix parasitica NIES-267]